MIEDGMLVLGGGRVLDAGSSALVRKSVGGLVRDLGKVTLMPASCNAHTHLELSYCLE